MREHLNKIIPVFLAVLSQYMHYISENCGLLFAFKVCCSHMNAPGEKIVNSHSLFNSARFHNLSGCLIYRICVLLCEHLFRLYHYFHLQLSILSSSVDQQYKENLPGGFPSNPFVDEGRNIFSNAVKQEP